jgi:hypothetical protein
MNSNMMYRCPANTETIHQHAHTINRRLAANALFSSHEATLGVETYKSSFAGATSLGLSSVADWWLYTFDCKKKQNKLEKILSWFFFFILESV